MIRSAHGVRIGVAAALLSVAGCAISPPAPIEPAALLRTENVIALAHRPSPLLRSALAALLEDGAALPDLDADTLAVVRDGTAVGWLAFNASKDTLVSRIPDIEASSPSFMTLVGTGASTLTNDTFFEGSAAAAGNGASWAYVARFGPQAPLAVAPAAVLSSTGTLAILWEDQRPAPVAAVGAAVPALDARAAVWFADGRGLLALGAAFNPDVRMSLEALLGAAVLQAFGPSTAPSDVAALLDGPGSAIIGPAGVSGSAIMVAGDARDGVTELLMDVRQRFAESRPHMRIDERTYERGFTSRVISLDDRPASDDVSASGGWTVHIVRQQFDATTLVTAEREHAFVLGTRPDALEAFLGAGTGTLSLPAPLPGSQREAAGSLSLDLLPPSLARSLAPLLSPLRTPGILWSLDRTGGASLLTLRSQEPR